jgi:hypothetical protein
MRRAPIIAIGVAAVIVILLIGLLIAGPSRQRTASNEWGCSFAAGPFEQSSALKGRLAPGDSHGYSNDRLKTGPSDVRFFYVDNDPATADFGTRPIEVPAKGSAATGVGVVPVRAEVQVRFTLNEKFCDLYVNNLKRIDDRATLNYNAAQGETSGWGEFLTLSMNQKLIEATRPVLANVDYITLYVNGPIDPDKPDELAYDVLADKLSTNLTREMSADLGDDYFCGPSYKFDGEIDGQLEGTGCPPLEVTVKSITPVDPKLVENLTAIVANEEQQRRIESDTQLANEQRRAEADRAVAASAQAQRQAEQQAVADQATRTAQAEANAAIAEAEAAANQRTQVAQANADKVIKEAQVAADREVRLAQAAADREVAVANAEREALIAEMNGPIAQQKAANTAAAQQAEATYCVTLAQAGIRCDLLASAEAGGNIVPNIDLSGSADSGSAATVVLDARP